MIIKNEGTVVSFKPESVGEYEWLVDNTDHEPYQWLGQTLVVDHRFAETLIEGVRDAGWVAEIH